MRTKFFFIFLFLAIPLFAQNNNLSTITIRANSQIEVPADIINIHISFGLEKQNPQLAFDEHKKLEKKLLQLIKKFGIPDSAITYSLLNIEKVARKNNSVSFKTSQNVKVTLNDFSQYYQFQIELLNNGFYDFGAWFSSTHMQEAWEKGYKLALKLAESSAQNIAQSLNRKLGTIVKISATVSNSDRLNGSTAIRVPSPSFLEIKQYLKIFMQLTVEFELK